MTYLLDTNIVSEIRKVKTGKADSNLVQWLIRQDAENLYLSAITCLEIEKGILQVARRDSHQAAILSRWRDEYLLPAFSKRILSLDYNIALVCARLHVPDPKSERDAMIGATAIWHNLVLVTRNTKDFINMDVSLLNPFEKNIY